MYNIICSKKTKKSKYNKWDCVLITEKIEPYLKIKNIFFIKVVYMNLSSWSNNTKVALSPLVKVNPCNIFYLYSASTVLYHLTVKIRYVNSRYRLRFLIAAYKCYYFRTA